MRITRTMKLLSYLMQNLTFLEFISTIWTTLFRNDLIYVFAVDPYTLMRSTSDTEDNLCGVDKNVIIRKGEIAELDEYCNRTGASAWEFNCHKFDKVEDFFIARDSDTIQCITWIYKRNDPNRYLILGERDVLLLFSLTLPEYRGRGLYSSLLRSQANYLSKQGFKRIYGLAEHTNSASIRGMQKAGFVKVGNVRLVKLFGIQLSRKLDLTKIV